MNGRYPSDVVVAELDAAVAWIIDALAGETAATRACADQWAAGARRMMAVIGVPVTVATVRTYLAASMAAYELVASEHPEGSALERRAHARVIGAAVLVHTTATGSARAPRPAARRRD